MYLLNFQPDHSKFCHSTSVLDWEITQPHTLNIGFNFYVALIHNREIDFHDL